MARKPDYSVAGTAPEVNGLDAIKKQLLENPQEEFLAVVEIRNASDHRHHPRDDASYRTITVEIVSIEPVTITDDQNTVREIARRAREARPGQQAMEFNGAEGSGRA